MSQVPALGKKNKWIYFVLHSFFCNFAVGKGKAKYEVQSD